MPTTQRSDLILPSILAEDVLKGFSGKIALANSGAMLVRPGMQLGDPSNVNNTVTVPYFEDTGEAQQVPEGAAGSLEKITMSQETNVVVRLFKAFSIASLAAQAKTTGRDIYDVARDAIQLAMARGIDSLAYVRALAQATAKSMDVDGSGGTITVARIIELLQKFGEELDDQDLALMAMNPKPYWDAAQLADSTGRTLLVGTPGERLQQIGGAPVRMTSKAALSLGGSPATYKSLLAKRGSMLAWYNETPKIDVTRDPTADIDVVIANLYVAIHAYGTMPGGTKCGVATLKTQ